MRKHCLVIFWFCLCWTTLKAEIVFDVTNVSHSFDGFGAQVWPGDMRVEQLYADLNIRYVRMCPGGCLNPPTDATIAQMDAYVYSEYYNTTRGNAVMASLQLAKTHNVKVIFNRFGGLLAWVDTSYYNYFLSQYFDDFARLIASEILFFTSRGYPVDYIELFNEPDGGWNIYVSPYDYNTIVQLVRAELNSRGLSNVGIIGPGCTWLQYSSYWIDALDSGGKNALVAWSTHAWDESSYTDALPNFLDQRWQDYFGAAVNLADPTHSKPIIVTEYATKVQTYNGVTFGDANVTDANQFAQRCYENSLTLVNNGANVLCYWEAANQSWQEQDPPLYGLLRTNSSYRPVYYAMTSLMPYIPNDAMVLTKTWNDPNISAAGFIGSGKLVLAFANSGATTVNRTISVSGVTSLSITSILAFQSGTVVNKTSDFSYDFEADSMAISLPPESALTIVADIQCTAVEIGDLNGDCKVTFADFGKIAADWFDDGRSPSPGSAVDNFESYSSTAEMLAKWTPGASNVVLTLDSSIVHSGSKAMKYAYNNGADPYFSKASCYLAPSGSSVNWTMYDTLTLWFKCVSGSQRMQVNVVNKDGSTVLNAPYGVPSVGDWTKWNIDLTPIAISEKSKIRRIDIFFLSNSGSYESGTVYFDDIEVSDSDSFICTVPLAGDATGDCVVNFEDVKVLGENWLECTLIEQSECW